MTDITRKVQGIYEAFGKGDVPAILEQVSADVEWEYGWKSSPIPWLAPGRGRDHVASFFATVGAQLQFEKFGVNQLLTADRLVVALVSLEAAVKATGKRIVEIDEVHVWRFDERGQVSRFRHAADTYGQYLALQP
jgi:ketosteroid isomerase-like protein